MNFAEFKEKVMTQPNFGRDPAAWEKFTSYLPKLKHPHQATLIAAVLDAGEAGLVKSQEGFAFVPMTSLSKDKSRSLEALPALITLLEDPQVADEDVKKIFSSQWMHTLQAQFPAERDKWIFAAYNFTKQYGMLFIEALKNQRPFVGWRGIPYPTAAKAENALELKPLLLQVLQFWPTGGRSGYALLTQLRELDAVKSVANDPKISAALDDVEGHCDFGSLEKVRAQLSEKEKS